MAKKIKRGRTGQPNIVTIPNIKKVLPGTLGSPSRIAERLGCTYSAIRHWVNERASEEEVAEYYQLLESERAKLVDKAEKHFENVLDMENNNTAIISEKTKVAQFVAKTQGRSRGYSEKVDIEIAGELQVKGYNIASPETFPALENQETKIIDAEIEES